jgi:CRP/FNR family transcriptional regulator
MRAPNKIEGSMIQHLRSLTDSSMKRKYTPGATILYQGEVPRSAVVLLSGITRVYSISKQGDDQVVMYHVPGEFFPTSWLFGKIPSTLYFYQAVTDVEIAFVPRDMLIDFMLKDSERLHTLLDYYATNFSASLIRINALQQPKARDKLIFTLFYLCQRYSKLHQQRVRIPFSLTHQNVASLVGLTRETTAAEMNKLKKEKVLTYDNQTYIVNMERLYDLMGEDTLRNVHIELPTPLQ